MPTRCLEIGTFDVAGADTRHYRSARLEERNGEQEDGSPGIGEAVTDVCRIEFEESRRLHGVKLFYELHVGAAGGAEAGLRKVIWQASARDSYWYPGPHNEDGHVRRMPDGIVDQSKQALGDRVPEGTRSVSHEIEKFVDPRDLAVSEEYGPGESLSVHARVSRDSTAGLGDVTARATVIAFTERTT